MDELVRSIRTKNIIEKYGFHFKKSLGQNFLIDGNILKKIVDAAELTKNSSVLEIGPGIGTLTTELGDNAGKVLTIEIDNNLIPILEDIFKDYPNIKLYHGDAMKINFKEVVPRYLDEPISICANLPYYITTPLITKFFKEGLKIKNIVLMVQKEVAERMAAEPGCREYGALSLLIQYYSKPSIEVKVPPGAFMPQPKVDSVVIKLQVYENPVVNVEDEELFFSVIRDSFNQRRKTLSNSLKNIGISKEDLNRAFNMAGIDSSRRGETLSLQEFAELSNRIYQVKKG